MVPEVASGRNGKGPADGRRPPVEAEIPCGIIEQDMVLMDNVAIHKVAGVREAIAAKGARLLFIPAYSPELNPIEKTFATLKAYLRRRAARTKGALWEAIGQTTQLCSPADCVNLFRQADYAI
jgi:hypothetical protein